MATRVDIMRFSSLLGQHLKAGTGRTPLRSGRLPAWTTDVFARTCGVTPQTVSNWRQARNVPTDTSFLSIARVLFGDTLDWNVNEDFLELRDAYWLAASRQFVEDDIIETGIPSQTPTATIPVQAAGPHFAVGAGVRIAHSSPDDFDKQGNNLKRINSLLPLVKEEAFRLLSYFSSSNNAFPELYSNLRQYASYIDEPVELIDWGLIWGLGVRLEEASIAIGRRVDRLYPDLEDNAASSLHSLRSLHSTLILATAEGRELQQQADNFRLTRDERSDFESTARKVSDELSRTDEIIEPEAAEILSDAVGMISAIQHPDRGATFGIAAIKHTSIVLLGAALIAGPGYYVGGLSGTALTMGTWEAMKKSAVYSAATTALGSHFSKLLESGG